MDVRNKIVLLRKAPRRLNLFLWNDTVSMENIKRIFTMIVGRVNPHVRVETWPMSHRLNNTMQVVNVLLLEKMDTDFQVRQSS